MSLRQILELKLKLIPLLFSAFKATLLALFSIGQERWWVAIQTGKSEFPYV